MVVENCRVRLCIFAFISSVFDVTLKKHRPPLNVQLVVPIERKKRDIITDNTGHTQQFVQ